MTKALESVTTFLGPLVTDFWTQLGRPGLDPTSWSTLTWSVAAFIVLLLALVFRLWGRHRARNFPSPELLVSRGGVVQLENSILQQLSLRVSNLGDYSVQLLEVALESSVLPEPVLIEAVELLRPHAAHEVTAILPTGLAGDAGVLKLYAYTARHSERVFELRANLEWEPRNKRYKVSPLGQSLRPARKLDTRLDALRKRAWLEYNPHQRPDPRHGPARKAVKPAPPETVNERRTVANSTVANSTVAKKGDLEFPNEF